MKYSSEQLVKCHSVVIVICRQTAMKTRHSRRLLTFRRTSQTTRTSRLSYRTIWNRWTWTHASCWMSINRPWYLFVSCWYLFVNSAVIVIFISPHFLVALVASAPVLMSAKLLYINICEQLVQGCTQLCGGQYLNPWPVDHKSTALTITLLSQRVTTDARRPRGQEALCWKCEKEIEGLHVRTEHVDIFLFAAHHSMVFYFRCSVYWWKWSVRF